MEINKNIILSRIKVVYISLFIWINYSTIKSQEYKHTSINMETGKNLRQVLNTLDTKSIIGLGEGTHGTKEFNQVRIALIKELINSGYKTIIFENAFGDSYYLNKELNSQIPIAAVMKKNLLSIWQTSEMKSFLSWVRTYNHNHSQKINIYGADFNYVSNAVNVLQEILGTKNQELNKELVRLKAIANLQDSIWNKQNDKNFNLDMNMLISNGNEGYELTQKIDNFIKQNTLNVSKPILKLAIENCSYAFATFYAAKNKTEEKSRDELMANMISRIQEENKKIIVWAHSAHVSLKSPYGDGLAMGGYLKKYYGENYYALGTLTAEGTYSATLDRIDTKNNAFKAYTLKPIVENSWEHYFSQNKDTIFFIDSAQNSSLKKLLKMKFIGYGPERENPYTEDVSINDFFDGIIFIKNTSAAVHSL